ncbi:MAG: hypothetical protein U9O65_02740 [Thermotogota bacterium]|nr:hypothetical protein [Thermotogota bacterium]
MKKGILGLTLVLVFGLFLYGCFGGGSGGDSTPTLANKAIMSADKNKIIGAETGNSTDLFSLLRRGESGNYTSTDVDGGWAIYALWITGGYNEWVYGNVTVEGEGCPYNGSVVVGGGPPEQISGDISVDVNGTVTLCDEQNNTMSDNGIMSADKNMMALVWTEEGGIPYYNYLISVKKGTGYIEDDLDGDWVLHDVWINLDDSTDNGWGYGHLKITNGDYSGNILGSDGEKDSVSGTISIDGNGKVTILDEDGEAVFGDGDNIMSADKNMIVGVYTEEESYIDFYIFTKRGESYSSDDLPGNWVMHGLWVGEDNGWNYGNVTVGGSGNFIYNGVNSEGESESDTGTTSIESNGDVNID